MATTPPATPEVPAQTSPLAPTRSLGFLRGGFLRGQKTAGAATILLALSALISRGLGVLRDTYIAHTFGAGPQTDAYNIAFNLPDLVSYLLVGGAASISFVTILSRYREEQRHKDGEVALSVILNTMALVLGGALLLAEFLTPYYIHIYSRGDAQQDALAVFMTRILLPGQLFFFAGGVLASVALVRKQFGYQAISPLIYSLGIIVGGVAGARWLGIPSLAWGALAGAICGPFLVNVFAAHRAGMRWRPLLDLRNEGLREWVRMSIPMMLGVTVVFMDTQILQYFAKHETGDITRLMNAKKLFTAPMAIIGQAAGAASLPFFASLYAKSQHEDFRNAVNRSVTRIACAGILITAAMGSLARSLCDLVLRGGHYTHADASRTAVFLGIFSLSLALWSAQAIYIRAFYAAGQTLPPMLAGTIVTLVALPVYWVLHAHFGSMGLAWASNFAILAHTITLAVLLHTRRLVNLGGLNYTEFLKAGVAAFVSFSLVLGARRVLTLPGGYEGDLVNLLGGSALWAVVCYVALRLMHSSLPEQLHRIRRPTVG